MKFLLLALLASASAFTPQAASLRSLSRVGPSSPVMLTEDRSTRRAMLASALLFAPAAAQAVVPGLNAPGLVKAKPATSSRPEWSDIQAKSSFWSPKGVCLAMDSNSACLC